MLSYRLTLLQPAMSYKRWILRPLQTTSRSSIMSANNRRPTDYTAFLYDLTSADPGRKFEVRQISESEDWHPDPSKSLPLSPARQRLIDDIIDLYSMKPTVQKIKRYTPDCVYNDQFVYANDRWKMAGQWYGLTKLFKSSVNEGYQVVRNDPRLIQFRNEQSWTFLGIHKTTTINALVSLSLDPDTADSDFPTVKYHKDQANEKDYSNTGLGAIFKKWQADHVSGWLDMPEMKEFEADKGKGDDIVDKHGSGTANAVQVD